MAGFHQNTIALVYDFDGTLSPEAMQHYGVLPELGIEPSAFWDKVKTDRHESRAEELLVYMREMIQLANRQEVRLDRDAFLAHGAGIEFFDGVLDWFPRIDRFVAGLAPGEDIHVEHYIVSSGLKDMIAGSAVAGFFREIYACEFLYDPYGHPAWPARVVSDTSKTQYLYRINKGVLDVNQGINSHMPPEDRAVPFDNMIYFGDGDTDVPSMAVTMQGGGHSVAVFQDEAGRQKCARLKEANRVDFYCKADYRDGQDLDRFVRNTLEILVARIRLRARIAAAGL